MHGFQALVAMQVLCKADGLESACSAGVSTISHRAGKEVGEHGATSSWQKKLQFLSELPGSRLAPNVFTMTAAIAECGKGTQWFAWTMVQAFLYLAFAWSRV